MRQIENNYAFIDSQNLNLGIKSQGWSLDFAKFRRYLANKHQIRKAYLFLGYIPENKQLYNHLKREGFRLIFKPVTKDRDGKVKGNVDADLVLYAIANYKKYDNALIVSGDGDFHGLVKHLAQRGKTKKLIIPNRHRYSRLLNRSFIGDITLIFLNDFRKDLKK